MAFDGLTMARDPSDVSIRCMCVCFGRRGMFEGDSGEEDVVKCSRSRRFIIFVFCFWFLSLEKRGGYLYVYQSS